MSRVIHKCPVAVVGGAGFLGSHLVHHLVKDRQCEVTVIDNLVVGRRDFLPPEANFIHHDITGSEYFLNRTFRELGIKFVFNYAACPYIPQSFSRPIFTSDVNYMGAMKVINAAQESGTVEAILQVSSAEIYGGPTNPHKDWQRTPINEQGEVAPHSTYGAAKAALDFWCQCAWKERHTPVIALRQFNCVGERETHPYIVPEIITQLARWQGMEQSTRGGPRSSWYDDPPKVRLGNNSKRDFLYAGDAVKMATELLEKGTFGEVYNLGSEIAMPIYNLVPIIALLMGHKVEVEIVPDPERMRPWEIWHLQSDNSKIYDVIKTRPKLSIDEAIWACIREYRQNRNKWAWERG